MLLYTAAAAMVGLALTLPCTAGVMPMPNGPYAGVAELGIPLELHPLPF